MGSNFKLFCFVYFKILMYSIKFFSYVADKWRLYKQISYYLVVALTIITCVTFG